MQAEQSSQVKFSEEQIQPPASEQDNLLLQAINMLQEQMQAIQAAISQPNQSRCNRRGRGNDRKNGENNYSYSNNNNSSNTNNSNQFGFG